MSTQVPGRPHVGARGSFVLRLLPFLGLAAIFGAGLAAVVRAEGRASPRAADWRGVSAQLDTVIDAKLAEQHVKPAPLADDAEFLRRVYLDVLGTVPTPDEVEAFLADRSKDKRAAKIDELLSSDSYAENQASFWFQTLTGMSVHQGRPREGQGGRYVSGEGGQLFHRWLAEQIQKNRPYDEMVSDLITATGRADENGAVGYLARWEGDANNLAGAVAKHFLGVRIQCAQCHDHKFEPTWKQTDFQGMAAFFALTTVRRVPEYNQLRKLRQDMQKERAARKDGGSGDGGEMEGPGGRRGMDREMAEKMRDLRKYANIVQVEDMRVNPRIAQRYMQRMKAAKRPEVKARALLMGTTPKFWMGAQVPDLTGIPRRYLLARWITSDDNPYFARTLVNRMWGHLMGRGIVSPVDDFNSFQAPSHPEILEILAKDFKTHGYDLKRLQRILLDTSVYQRSSRWPTEAQPDPALFAKAQIRPLTTEQLYFSLVRATGLETRLNRATRRAGEAVQRAIFANFTYVFDDDEGAAEENFHGTIPEGLFLMNGQLLQRALSGGRDVPKRRGGARSNRRFRQRPAQSMLEQLLRDESSDSKRVEALYLRAYGREPSTSERADAVHFVRSQGSGAKAYEDFFWAILNSAEFMTNH